MSSTTIRVLLTDDSAVTRRMVTEAITADREIEVVGAARNGAEALQMLKLYQPDLIVLDVEMPVLDGVETVAAVRAIDAHVPIIMFSSITTRGGQATLDALTAGATDYVTKPTRLGHVSEALAYIRSELIPKIKLWGRRYRLRSGSLFRATRPAPVSSAAAQPNTVTVPVRPAAAPAPHKVLPSLGSGAIEIVAIGVSTGGPNTLAEVLARIPATLPVPILIVQHMPAIFTRLLADRLNSACPLNVREGIDGAELQAGDVWIAPGNYHMTVRQQQSRRFLSVTQEAHENSCRPSADPLFRSVASVYGPRCMGVILTGMGRDGEAGCRAIRQAGGRIIVQDEASSVVWGMPRAVLDAGLADEVLGVSQISQDIVDRTRRVPARNSSVLVTAR